METSGETLDSPGKWITTGNKRRTSPPRRNEQPSKQTKLSDYWLDVPTINRYSDLEVSDTSERAPDESSNEREKSIKQPRPPPIFIYNVKDVQPLMTLLNEMAPKSYTLRALVNNQIKLQLQTIDLYRSVIKVLQEKGTQLHSYQIKTEKSYRTVLRNLHHSIDAEEIKAALAEKGHTVVNVHNVKHRVTKKPLPIFFINLAPKNNDREIFNISTLLNCVVKFEAPNNKKRDIPQCTRCQDFLHTKSFCHKVPKCVKCLGSHLSSECSRKERDTDVKCTNCSGPHPANYKGCRLIRNFKLFPALRQRRDNPTHSRDDVDSVPGPSSRQITSGISYRNALAGASREESQSGTCNVQSSNELEVLTPTIAKQTCSKALLRCKERAKYQRNKQKRLSQVGEKSGGKEISRQPERSQPGPWDSSQATNQEVGFHKPRQIGTPTTKHQDGGE
uniref:Pre-C2HC domain-containing protein n=1 Tax=Phlebotomus papatasi TaxID=29031 RepID=A0A1B0DEN7_PHLPP